MQELLQGCGSLLLYFIICAAVAITVRMTLKMADELFRKILHVILLGSLMVCVNAFDTWYMAVGVVVVFAIIVYPILNAAERIKNYSQIMTERKQGELKSSLLVVFAMFAIVLSVCWGYFNDRLLAVASIYAWGIGDAFAALIGKKYGKHKITKAGKSIEGTFSMFLCSVISVFVVLMLREGMGMLQVVVISVCVGTVSTLAELYTPNGMDTFTCPLAAMLVLLPLVKIFGGGI